ncbi:sensor histidine kinase [Aestuariispira insulae]|uniref:histidine kinase n=1 Tax=Aestuariispira insulae TaxID=1461337 RepID=A0A3D9HGG6_9PROT|nr:hybrid sensor histidine kinase/response regulator [Aestuariispira insulae]RED48592.1 response regulator receiver sensor signal transduction histidine kinase [Aestuariispira insulae]
MLNSAQTSGEGAVGEPEGNEAQHRRICVLIIDDDHLDRLVIKKALIDSGRRVEILEADRLETAEEILEQRSPDCIFLDYLMPDGSSLSFLETLQADFKNRYLGVILITGQGDEEVATTAMRLGAIDYLPKDRMTPDKIMAAVRQALADLKLKREVDAQRHVIENFAALLAHDLRDPLSATLGFLNLALESDRLEGEDRTNVTRALEGARYAVGLVNELVQYARNGSREFAIKAVSLEEVLLYARDVVLQSQAVAEGVEIELHGPFPWVEGNFEALTLLFQNLFQNSVKYRKPDEIAHVSVRFREVGDKSEIRVRDNGRGIAPEERDRIFRPLTRGSQVGEQRGYGLGLATCVRVVGLFDGDIRVESALGEGAEFIVTLPTLFKADPE